MSGPPERATANPEPGNPPQEPDAASHESFIVGIGASAGGFEAISELLKQLPELAGLAIVIVQHLDPNHESHLVELLGRTTTAPVRWGENGCAIKSGHIYVIPPHTCATIRNRVLLLAPAGDRTGGEISFLFRSLADDVNECAVGVILSGNGTDGVVGLRAIKAASGVVFAQDPATARFPAMAQAAIDAGCVDRVLPPTGIAKGLANLRHETRQLWERVGAAAVGGADAGEAEQLAMVFRLLAARTGVDFSDYKPTTINRRIVRRMMLTKVTQLGDYVKLLQKSRDEVQQLYETLLINVTEFFRDPECFDFIRERVLPPILKLHEDATRVRIWVPGCATGEEPYSIAIVLRELIEETGNFVPVQIFGTDVSEPAISIARAAFYTPAEVASVTPERLSRYFFKTDRGYIVQKPIRDMCIFARQNVVKDSPFSRIDLISCRNLLIYFGPKLQRKLMPIFHYALNPSGCLVLGSSESVGDHAELFRLVDRRFRIYTRKSTSRRMHLDFPPEGGRRDVTPTTQPIQAPIASEMKESFDVIREADRVVLSRHGPTGVVVSDDLEVMQFRGDVSPYLAPLSGRATLNVIKLAREGLGTELQIAVQQAREQSVRVQRKNVIVMHDQGPTLVDVDVTPIESVGTRERFYLVLFRAADSAGPAADGDSEPKASSQKIPESAQLHHLRQELQATRSSLQSAIEKHETTNQELRAANEEIQSSNEELQSTNEELETAKEELQSTNEELTTVNEELHSRQLDLIQLNNDLQNLINSAQLSVVILGQDLRIRRFTPMAEKVLNIIPTDIGRPLSDINIGLEVRDLPRLIAEVIDSLAIKELEVQDRKGRWYSLRLRPYKTAEKKIEGAVLTLIDIDGLKRALGEAEEARNLAQAVIEMMREPLVVLTGDLRIQSANDAFYRMFRTSRERAESRPFLDTMQEPEKLADLRAALEGILPTRTSLTNHAVRIDLPGAGPTTLVVEVRQITSGVRPLILVSLRSS